ncbi:MAG: M15 family metallopeptidase [bacterium]|nr:M15 family metallopeptidase [bacterium]
MAIYDDENPDPNEGKNPSFRERRAAKQTEKSDARETKAVAKDEKRLNRAENSKLGIGRGRAGEAFARQGEREKAALQKKLGSTASGLAQKDTDNKENDSFFKTDKKGNVKKRRFAGISMGKRAAAGAAGAGILGIGLSIFGLFSFLGNFQLEHLLNNIDSQTFSRFNATFDRRSDRWMRSYVRMRLTEFGEGGGDRESTAFRAWNVDTDNPARDWYRSNKTSNWEKELFEEEGIVVTSIRNSDGISAATITVNLDQEIPFDVISRYSAEFDALDPTDLQSVLNLRNAMSGEFDELFSTQVFKSDAEARKYLRQQSREKFGSHEVLKRYHFRKDRQNMIGVRDWRFFEKTRTRIETKKIDIQSRIINKVFSGNGNINKFLNCLLDPKAKCARNADPANPETQSGKPGTTDGVNDSDTNNDNGTPNDTSDDIDISGTSDADSEKIADAAQTALEAPDPNVSSATDNLLPSEKFAKELRGLLKFNGPATAWRWLKRIAVIDKAIGDGGPQLISVAKNARLQNVVAVHTMLTTARDQIRTGEIDGEDFGATMELMQTTDWGNSEGWSMVNDVKQNSVEAAAIASAIKNEYCAEDYVKKPTDFAWFCDNNKPNGGGKTVEDFVNGYENSVGKVFGPIADAVNGVKGVPGFETVADFFASASDGIITTVTDAFGVTDDINKLSESVSARAMEELLKYFGLSPSFDGSNPGETVNFAAAGSAGGAETSTRDTGGIASTPESRAYTTQLAIQYQQELRDDMSIYERYASLDNHESVAAKSLFAISTKSWTTNFVSAFKNVFSFSWAKSFFLSPANAQATDARDLADWAGVDKYDIPPECVEMDPLSMTIYSGTNFDEVANRREPGKSLDQIQAELGLTWDEVRDSSKFYAEVYRWAGEGIGGLASDAILDLKSQDAQTIYSCHILDARVQDSLGFTNGYSSGTGLDSQVASSTVSPVNPGSPNDGGVIIGDPGADSSSIACAAGTTDLGVTQDAYSGGNKVSARLCAIPGFKSKSDESNPGTTFYVDGADGNAIVNSRVSGAWLALFEAAKADGLTLAAVSSYRTYAHQDALCNDDAGCSSGTYNAVAKPGRSNHQAGHAVDLDDASFGGAGPGSTTCANKQTTDSRTYKWMELNAKKFGIGQLANESWHWDAGPGRCGL